MHTTCPAVDAKLTQFQRRVLEFIERNSHKPQGICQATRTLADRFGVSVSYVQKTLKRLRDLGLISRVWDYALRTRRRFFLGDPPTPLLNGPESAQSTDQSPFTDDIPPDPPIEDSGEKLQGESASGDEGSPTSLSPSEPNMSEIRKATPDEVRAVVEKATPVLRLDPETTRAKITAWAKRWRLSWVISALERAAEKAASETLRNPSGYVVRTLESFAVEGGPTVAEPPPPAESILDRIRRLEAEEEAFLASLGS